MTSRYDALATIDETLAQFGDLDARERVLKRRRIERLERQDAAESSVQAPMAAGVPDATRAASNAPAVASKRASKGTAPGTLHAIRAIAAVIHRDGVPSRGGAAGLARAAADLAATLGLPGADSLNPSGGTMREIAGMTRFVADGALAPSEIATALTYAGRQAGLEAAQVKSTLASALRARMR